MCDAQQWCITAEIPLRNNHQTTTPLPLEGLCTPISAAQCSGKAELLCFICLFQLDKHVVTLYGRIWHARILALRPIVLFTFRVWVFDVALLLLPVRRHLRMWLLLLLRSWLVELQLKVSTRRDVKRSD